MRHRRASWNKLGRKRLLHALGRSPRRRPDGAGSTEARHRCTWRDRLLGSRRRGGRCPLSECAALHPESAGDAKKSAAPDSEWRERRSERRERRKFRVETPDDRVGRKDERLGPPRACREQLEGAFGALVRFQRTLRARAEPPGGVRGAALRVG